jgi:putative transposase
MKRSKIVLPIHLVWTTKNREGWIVPEIEERVHRSLFSKAEELGASVLAIGGMPDHVHIALLLPSTITVAMLVKQLKGASQNLASEVLLGRRVLWQEGYGAFGFSMNHAKKVTAYIRTQKQRHAQDQLWPTLENSDEEAPITPHPEGASRSA